MMKQILTTALATCLSTAIVACGAHSEAPYDDSDDGTPEATGLGEVEDVGVVTAELGIPTWYTTATLAVRGWRPDVFAFRSTPGTGCMTQMSKLDLAAGTSSSFLTFSCGTNVRIGATHADGTQLFFADTANNRIYKKAYSASASTPATVFLNTVGAPVGALEGGSYLYYADSEGVHKKRKDGTGINALLLSGAYQLLGSESSTLYLANMVSSSRQVQRLSTSGGTPTPLIWNYYCHTFGGDLCFKDFTFNNDYFYWSTSTSTPAQIQGGLKTDTQPTMFVSTPNRIVGPVTDGVNLYWAENPTDAPAATGSSIRRCAVGPTCTPATELANLPHVNALRLGAGHLYWEVSSTSTKFQIQKATTP